MSYDLPTPATTGTTVGGADMNRRADEAEFAGGRTSAVSDPPGIGQNDPDNGPAPTMARFVNGGGKFTPGKLRPQELGMDALGVIVVDSVRRERFAFEPKIMGSYLAASALYQMFGYPLLGEALQGTVGDSQTEYAAGKIVWNAVAGTITSRVFGRESTVGANLATSFGAEIVSYAAGQAMGGGPYVGPFP